MSEPIERKAETAGIQVYLRIRPTANPLTHFQRDDIDLKSISVKVPKNDDIINNSRTAYNFSFSGILDDKVSQRDVFRTVGIPAIQNALAGFNSTIFAYGQTGSGKTFTITGGPKNYEDRGLIPRALSHLFGAMKDVRVKGSSFSCFVSYLEIYNESGYDLLMQSSNGEIGFEDIPKVMMLEDENGSIHFKNLSIQAVASEEDALNLLFVGDTNRAIAATEMNQNSTRSHCIFTIMLEKRTPGTDTVMRSKLNIVDLAGSERVSRTSSTGQTLKEAKYINSSLFFLEMVIVALHERDVRGKSNNVHVPYRNSMMTSVLRDSLGGNCKTTMIATISPDAQFTDESVSTCHFAQRVALVKNSATVNEEIEPELVIQRLRAEVRRLREEVEFLSRKHDDDDGVGGEKQNCELSRQQMCELTDSIRKYVHDCEKFSRLDFCGGITLPRIRAVCAIFKDFLLRKRNEMIVDDDESKSDKESSEKNEISFAPTTANSQVVKESSDKNNASNKGDRNRTPAPNENKIEKENTSKVNCICGVPMCKDQQVIAEPNLAFAWFKDRYPETKAIDENKDLLKTKITEAKTAGKRIEEIRARIRQHKDAIEKVRASHAISMVSGHEEKMSECAQEKIHCDAINLEKIAYNETLDRLGGLKGSIENIQKLVEAKRVKLQSDFDIWYRQVSIGLRDDNADLRRRSMANEDRKEEMTCGVRQPSLTAEVVRVPKACGTPKMTQLTVETQFKLPPGVKLTGNQQMDDASSTTVQPTVETQFKLPFGVTLTGNQHMDDASRKTVQPTVETQFKLPSGVKLTGNQQVDDDVIRFYKAKEVLLSKLKR